MQCKDEDKIQRNNKHEELYYKTKAGLLIPLLAL